ncbi:FUSC family protein [Chitinophaga parva]|nr:FUSC family protein [Chitinophaga parva]
MPYDKAFWSRLLVYIAKSVTGVVIVYLLSWLVNYNDRIWCLISVMLVLSPDGKDATSLAMNRIKANAVGAAVGFLVLAVYNRSDIYAMCVGIALTVVACTFLKLEAPTRSALAATIIILTHEAGRHIWDTAVERLISVMAGCVLGLVITLVFHSRFVTRTVAGIHDDA